jgi:beta-phosphoglucomutase-like phosphatase (HAD superfamily)
VTELVIFDCDGVLVDSEPISVRLDVEMLAELGLTMTEEEVIERFVGRSPDVIVQAVEAELGHPPPDGWFEAGEQRLRERFSASEVAKGKPAPDLFLHAAARLGAEPAGCVVVEDSRYGVEAARAADMDVFAYAGGVTPARVLEGVRTVVFDDMRALPELLCRR